jgi:hypothetical protein
MVPHGHFGGVGYDYDGPRRFAQFRFRSRTAFKPCSRPALANVLTRHAFTGTIESQLEQRLGRPIQPVLADLGRLIFFDSIQGLHNDNSCAG